jgi:glycosyltransferase involved in cell wall biosynthesis
VKILQLCKFFPPVPGGMEAVVFELAEGLAARGVDVDVLCANAERRTVRESADAGYRVMRAARWGSLLSTSISPALAGEVRRLGAACDLVHVHLPDPQAALLLRCSPPRGPLVVHWHSDVVRQRLTRPLYEPLQQWLLARAAAVIATSQAYAESSPWVRRWAAKTTVIPIGIGERGGRAEPAAVAAVRRRFGDRRIVFSLGRMTAYKGFDLLVECAGRLPADCVIVIGGEGHLLERHRRAVRDRGLAAKVVFPGRIAAADLPAYFEAASVFCLPSVLRSEAYGVVLVEAMARGKPVVATEIPGSGVSWVNESGITGINVPVGNPQALADALSKILDDEVLAGRFGRAARQRYLDRLTASAMVDATLRLYQHLLLPAQGI